MQHIFDWTVVHLCRSVLTAACWINHVHQRALCRLCIPGLTVMLAIVLWLPQLCLELGRRGVPADMFPSSDRVFTAQVLANGLYDWSMLPRPAVCLACPLPGCDFVCSAEQTCAIACTPLPVFHQCAWGSWSNVKWGGYIARGSDMFSYRIYEQCFRSKCYNLVSWVLAMPQLGTPLQHCVLSCGRGGAHLQPAGGSRSTDDARSSRTVGAEDGLSDWDTGTADHSFVGAGHVDPTLGDNGATANMIPHELGLPVGGATDTSSTVTVLNPAPGGERRLGLYARISLRLTSRLPVVAPSPSMSKTLSYDVPRPTIALRLRPKTRAVAKMLVRSRLRCQCCFHRLGFCMREKAEPLLRVLYHGNCVFAGRQYTMAHMLIMAWQAPRGLHTVVEVWSLGDLCSGSIHSATVRLHAVRTRFGMCGQLSGVQTSDSQVGPLVQHLLRYRVRRSTHMCAKECRKSSCSLMRVGHGLMCCLLGTQILPVSCPFTVAHLPRRVMILIFVCILHALWALCLATEVLGYWSPQSGRSPAFRICHTPPSCSGLLPGMSQVLAHLVQAHLPAIWRVRRTCSL